MDSSKKYDNPSPEESANFVSKILFCWVLPFFKIGYKKDLEAKDLYNATKNNLSSTLGDLLEKHWEDELRRVKDTKERPQLWRAIKKSFFKVYFVYGFYNFLQGGIIRIIHPLILAEYIKYFSEETDYTYGTAWILGTIVVFFSFVNALLMHNQSRGCQEIGMRCRVACCSLLYRKLLKLNKTSLGNTASGQVINLMSNDVSRFDTAFLFMHMMWIMPLQAIIAACVMYNSIGVAALVGLLAIAIQSIPLQGFLSKIQGKLRKKTAERTDYRVKLMSEITSGIQIIKMYAWERPFAKIVELSRRSEINIITKSSYIRGFLLALAVFTERTSLYVTVVIYVLMGYPLTSDKVFSMAQFFNTIQLYMAIFFPMALVFYAEMKVSIKRIEDFLLKEEKLTTLPIDVKNNKDVEECIKPGTIVLDKIKASWISNPIICTLNDLNFELKPGTLCCVIGSVGSGKSSLLQLLLKELPIGSGKMIVNGQISYASQEPWLFVSSVRNNILFGQTFNRLRYRDVVRVCALERDFKQFLNNDRTLVGERGVSLSGGQRARINLARSVYRDADIYLLDDPLSAVDTHVAKHLFEQCVKKYLNGKTRILVTHQVQFLKEADVIMVMNNGQIEAIGTYNELEKKQLATFKSENNESVDEIANAALNNNANATMQRKISISSENSTNVDEEEEPQETQELVEKGAVSRSVYKEYFLYGANVFTLIVLILFVILAQVICNASDIWVTYWTNNEEQRLRKDLNLTTVTTTVNPLESSTWDGDILTTRPSYVLNLNSTLVLNATNSTEPAEYQREQVLKADYTQNEYIYIYTIVIVLSVLLTTFRSMFFFKVCMNASKNLHNTMFSNVLEATMRFFDTNPSGRILNRFSKDIGSVDELLPSSMLDALQIFMVMLGILCMVFIVTPWMVGPAVILTALYILIRNVYLSTAQDIKRLEGITRSPVFSHVTASLDGLTTIRSNMVEKLITNEFDVLQDQHTSAWYLFIVTSRAFGFYLDLISTLFLSVVTFQFLIFESENALGGNVGLVISQSLILTGMVQHGIRQSAEVVSQMTSVERILQYTRLDKEGPFETLKRPPVGWPDKGEIRFEGAYLRYAVDSPPVLKNINFVIEPGHKVGVVGRTGAGKSSLISALFRLSPIDGTIKIDGIDTKNVGLLDLRSNISIIPQEPVLFTTSIRHNLDPFDKCNDEDLWRAIENVELKDAVDNLDRMVQEGGSNFSAGQRQLICLARAIIRNNRILVMDEATANVDIQTDELIQNTIRANFKDCTVITIAHRLKTIMDSDDIIVMDAGQVVEIGSPYVLLQKTDGYLANMVDQVDNDTQKMLRNIAKDAYDKLEEERSKKNDLCLNVTKETK